MIRYYVCLDVPCIENLHQLRSLQIVKTFDFVFAFVCKVSLATLTPRLVSELGSSGGLSESRLGIF